MRGDPACERFRLCENLLLLKPWPLSLEFLVSLADCCLERHSERMGGELGKRLRHTSLVNYVVDEGEAFVADFFSNELVAVYAARLRSARPRSVVGIEREGSLRNHMILLWLDVSGVRGFLSVYIYTMKICFCK